MKALRVLKYVGFGILGVAFLILVVFGVQALWNWLIPELFNGPVITFWQTAGLFLLSKILLSGFAPGNSGHKPRGRWKHKYDDMYHRRCDEKRENEPVAQQ
ncbi:MAG: hypothetical protein U0X39_16465 [Bacteroidales bacterium]